MAETQGLRDRRCDRGDRGGRFIGSHIVLDLASAGMRVVVSDLLRSDGKWRHIEAAQLHDLVRPEALFDWLGRHGGKIAAIIHMAAIATTTETDVDRYVASNVRLTLDLWDWCTANQMRFIYASSAATYGDGSAGFADDESPAALATLRPLNPYGWSKHLVDRRLISDVARGLPTPPQWAGLKFFNVYGANESHKGPMQSMVSQASPVIRAGEPVTLFRSHHPPIPMAGNFVILCTSKIASPWSDGFWTIRRSTVFLMSVREALIVFLDLARAVYAELGISRIFDLSTHLRHYERSINTSHKPIWANCGRPVTVANFILSKAVSRITSPGPADDRERETSVQPSIRTGRAANVFFSYLASLLGNALRPRWRATAAKSLGSEATRRLSSSKIRTVSRTCSSLCAAVIKNLSLAARSGTAG